MYARVRLLARLLETIATYGRAVNLIILREDKY